MVRKTAHVVKHDGCIDEPMVPNDPPKRRACNVTGINRRYFDNMLADRRLSLRGLAAKMGLGHSQLSLTFSGARKMTLEEAAQLSNIFGEPIHKIVENAGVAVRPSSGKRVNVIGNMIGDGTVSAYNPGTIERTSAPDGLPEDTVAIQCRTIGSPNEWMDGFVFFCRQTSRVETEAIGRLSYCKIKDGPAVIAMVRRGYVEGTYNLSGPFQRENAALEWAAPIVITRN